MLETVHKKFDVDASDNFRDIGEQLLWRKEIKAEEKGREKKYLMERNNISHHHVSLVISWGKTTLGAKNALNFTQRRDNRR